MCEKYVLIGNHATIQSNVPVVINVRKDKLLSKDWCELIFEGRNKQYGAYAMRARFGTWNLIALAILSASLLLLFFIPFFITNYVRSFEKNVQAEVTSLSKLELPDLKKDPTLKAVATTTPVKMRALKNAVRFVPEIAEEGNDELLIAAEAEQTEVQANEQTPDIQEVQDGEPEGEDRTSKYPSPVEIVEEMPQFPGGLSALMKWLDKNIRYPAGVRRKHIEGEVRVTFIIDTEGNVREPQIAKSIDRTLDDEILRTVRKMPPWIPGRVNGKQSNVRITIPVVFQLN